jgi:hypothetical protein
MCDISISSYFKQITHDCNSNSSKNVFCEIPTSADNCCVSKIIKYDNPNSSIKGNCCYDETEFFKIDETFLALIYDFDFKIQTIFINFIYTDFGNNVLENHRKSFFASKSPPINLNSNSQNIINCQLIL